MIDLHEVDSANRMLDQMTDDFHLERLDDDEREEAKEAADRKEEYSRICLYLVDFMALRELAGVASRIMHHWSSEEDSYYMDTDGSESLFYRNFQISNHDGHWMCEWQESNDFTFFDADLMSALKAIDAIIKSGELV